MHQFLAPEKDRRKRKEKEKLVFTLILETFLLSAVSVTSFPNCLLVHAEQWEGLSLETGSHVVLAWEPSFPYS